MIRADRHKCEFKGTHAEILSELTMLINELFDQGVIDEDDMNMVIKLGLKSRKELEQDALTHMLALAAFQATIGGDDEMKDLLDKLLGSTDDEG